MKPNLQLRVAWNIPTLGCHTYTYINSLNYTTSKGQQARQKHIILVIGFRWIWMNLAEFQSETVGVEFEWLASLPLWKQIGHPPFPMHQNWCRKPCHPARSNEVGLHRLRGEEPLIFFELKRGFTAHPLFLPKVHATQNSWVWYCRWADELWRWRSTGRGRRLFWSTNSGSPIELLGATGQWIEWTQGVKECCFKHFKCFHESQVPRDST